MFILIENLGGDWVKGSDYIVIAEIVSYIAYSHHYIRMKNIF